MVTREDVQKTERMVDKFVKEMDELKYNIEKDRLYTFNGGIE